MTDNFQEQIDSLRRELTDLRENLALADILDYKPRQLGKPINDAKWVGVVGAGFFMAEFIYRCAGCGSLHKQSVNVPAHTKDGSVHSVRGDCGQITAVQLYKGLVPAKSEAEVSHEPTPEERLKSYSSKQ
jgi:hypothetical protein